LNADWRARIVSRVIAAKRFARGGFVHARCSA
jgi:hypothetical protein